VRNILALGAFMLLCACETTQRPEPEIRTVTVKVATPIPCPALADLGPEPEYADSDAAIAVTEDIGELAKLYVVGRLQRLQRLAEYSAAAVACKF
jgi:predicted component of type VI protein secretion system